jgi:hypothetical protein
MIPIRDLLLKAASFCFVLLIIALPWSIAPMSIAVALTIPPTLILWIWGRDRTVLATPVAWPHVAWMAAMGLSAAFAMDPAASAGRLAKALFPALVPLAAWHGRHWIAGRRAVIFLFVAAGVAWTITLVGYLAQGVTFPVRARGPSGHYMTFAGQLELITSVALGIAFVARGPWRRAAFGLVGLGTLCLIVTFTRSAWLGMLASAAVILALWRPLRSRFPSLLSSTKSASPASWIRSTR